MHQDSDLNRRLAFIAIDNAVELMIKTYLSLPKRVTGVTLSRTKYEEIVESFPRLLDAFAEHASERLDGVELGDIEWFHRLRNLLYHEGAGITVERQKVEVYATVARTLFKNLFGSDLEVPTTPTSDRIGRFLIRWTEIERDIQAEAAEQGHPQRALFFPLTPAAPVAVTRENPEALQELNELRRVRNEVVHEGRVPTDSEIQSLEKWAHKIRELRRKYDALSKEIGRHRQTGKPS
jgi:hypothetical protein